MRAPAHRAAVGGFCLAWLAAGVAVALAGAPLAHAAPLTVQALGRDGKPLPGTVVFLESREARAAARPLPGLEVAQVGRQFVPQVTVLTVGSELRFPNRDSVRHHVYSFSPAKTFELKLYTGTPAHPVVFDKPGIAVLGCNIHDQMVAWVVVVETPHHGQTGADGALKLEAPAGSYRLRSWHPALPPGAPAADQPLELPAAGASITLRLPLTAASL
jgi:plastocyanin